MARILALPVDWAARLVRGRPQHLPRTAAWMSLLISRFILPPHRAGGGSRSAWEIPIVVGTTGMSADEKARIAAVATKIPIIHAPNFSVGVNVLFKLATLAAKTLGEAYDIEIVEAHHNQKADAPAARRSGLAEAITKGLDVNLNDVAVYGRQGITGKRTKKEIGIHAVRMADVVGEPHRVFCDRRRTH